MFRLLPVLCIATILAAATACADEPACVPFPVDWNVDADSPASMAFLLDAPAGRDGFIGVAQGHLVRPDGKRFRIWGINITGGATLPTREAAPKLAAHLARCGVNCVRLHFLDLPARAGLVVADRYDTQALDPAQLEKLDFFIAQLRERGIYTDLNLNVGRRYKPGDGVVDAELLGFAKALTYFDPRLIQLQQQYAAQLLTHRNPYTGHEYRHEPAVALVELVNENSIVESWVSDRLLGQTKRKNPGTWSDIPASYERELTQLYNRWLAEHCSPSELGQLREAAGVASGAAIPRLRTAQFKTASPLRFRTEAAFYVDIERQYFDRMAQYLRSALGVKPLLLATSDHNHWRSGYPLLSSTSRLDVVDGHDYWQHPDYITDPKTGRQMGFKIANTPMVNDPLHSTVVRLSRSAIAGKPYTVSEINHPFPHEYACEGVPILAAYAAFHDWDGVFWYTLAHQQLIGETPRAIGYFDLGPDPVKMTEIAAGAVVFLRSDVRPARETVARSYSREQVLESLRLPGAEKPYFTPGFPLSLPLVHATRIASLDGPPTGSFPAPTDEPFRSDTGELCWSGAANQQGLFVMATARSQAIIGFAKARTEPTENLALRVRNPFCAVTLSALDGQPIAHASRLLLATTARVANTGMQWNEKRTTLTDWGRAPACIEPVVGEIALRNLDAARAVTAQPLDGAGRVLGAAIQATASGREWTIPVGKPATTWYVIHVAR
jgi:hypothetical protein